MKKTRIAVATDNGLVSAHFGRCPLYVLADIEDGKVKATETVGNPGHEPGKIPAFLHEKGTNVIVAGGMGPRAVGLFHDNNIEVIMGASGSVEAVIADYAAGNLVAGPSTCTEGGGKGYGVDKTVCDHE